MGVIPFILIMATHRLCSVFSVNPGGIFGRCIVFKTVFSLSAFTYRYLSYVGSGDGAIGPVGVIWDNPNTRYGSSGVHVSSYMGSGSSDCTSSTNLGGVLTASATDGSLRAGARPAGGSGRSGSLP